MFVTGLATGLWIGVSAGFLIAALMINAKQADQVPCGEPGPSCPRYWEAESKVGCWLDCPLKECEV